MRTQSRLQLVIMSSIGALMYSCAVIAGPFAYVGNNERKLFVIDTATNTVTATLPLPEFVSGIAVSPDGRRVYAANSQQVFVINASTNSIIADIPTGTGPNGLTGIAVNPAGTRVYVTSNWNQSILKVIDTGNHSVVSTIDFGRGSQPLGVAVHPNGSRIYVAQAGSGSLAVIDASTNLVTNRIPLSGPCSFPSPWGVAVDPAGSRVYVADQNCSDASGNSYVYVIDAASESVSARVGTAGTSARGLTVSPDGTRLYVSNGAVVDTASLRTVGQMDGSSMIGIAVHPDGSRVYLHAGGDVGVMDARTLKPVTWIHVGGITYVLGQFVGPLVSAPATVMPAIEYHHRTFDHYFITWMPDEIAKLDAGTQIQGWTRTGYSFKTYTTAQSGTSPVCRYYIPPALGDSHFFGRGTVECNETGQKNPTFELEAPAFLHMLLPAQGVCPANTTKVYRVFSNRPDANHRYMTDPVVRDQMVARGWWAEGDGPDLVVMCAPQ